jgi:uncharacterized membrane protein YqhA
MFATTSARAIARPRARAAPATRRAPASDRRAAFASCSPSGRVSAPRSRVSFARVVAARASADPRPPKSAVHDSYDDDGSGSYDDEELVYPNLEMSYDHKDLSNPWPRKPLAAMGLKEKFEYIFVRITLVAAGAFALLGVVASLTLSGLLFAMGMKEVAIHAVGAFAQNNAVGLVSAAVGALDRFLLGMVCLVFGLGSFELFLARSNREGEVRDRRLKKLAWLRVSSIDDLEQKVGEIIVAVMVVNLLEMSLHMKYSQPVDLVFAALAAFFSAGALAVLHWSSMKHGGAH